MGTTDPIRSTSATRAIEASTIRVERFSTTRVQPSANGSLSSTVLRAVDWLLHPGNLERIPNPIRKMLQICQDDHGKDFLDDP